MANGRIYRLRKLNKVNSVNIVNYFNKADYSSLGSQMGDVFKSDLVELVEVKTENDKIEPFLTEILEENGFTVGDVNYISKKLKFQIKGSNKHRANAVSLLRKIKGDRIISVDLAGDYPVGISRNDVRVPLKGVTPEQAQSSEEGPVSIPLEGSTDTANTGDANTGDEESNGKFSPNWLLIGGIVLVGLIALLAVIKLTKK